MSINGVSFGQLANTRPYGYDPEKGEFTREQAMKDFRPGIMPTPEQQEKAKKRTRALLITAGVVIAAGLTYFFTKGKGKDWIKLLIDKIKGNKKAVEDVVEMTASEKATKAAEVARKVDTKHVGGKGRKIVEEALKDCPTAAEQAAYDAAIAFQAPTAEQAAFIAKNNKPAVNTIGDFVAKQQAENLAKVTATKVAELQAENLTKVTAAKVAELQAKIAKHEAAIAKYSSNPAMARYAKPYEAAKAKLVQELEQLQGTLRAAA